MLMQGPEGRSWGVEPTPAKATSKPPRAAAGSGMHQGSGSSCWDGLYPQEMGRENSRSAA